MSESQECKNVSVVYVLEIAGRFDPSTLDHFSQRMQISRPNFCYLNNVNKEWQTFNISDDVEKINIYI